MRHYTYRPTWLDIHYIEYIKLHLYVSHLAKLLQLLPVAITALRLKIFLGLMRNAVNRLQRVHQLNRRWSSPEYEVQIPKPLTTGQLHQGQVRNLVDDYNSPDNTATQKLNEHLKGATDNLTGAGHNWWRGLGSLFPPEITHKTSGCGKGGKECERLQVGWTNGANKSDLRVSITIPSTMKVQDTATLQMGGSRHSGDCTSVQGYKAYIGINGATMEMKHSLSCGHKVYPHDFPNSNKAPLFTLKPGHTYNLRGTKENLRNGVRVTAYTQEDNGPVTIVANNYLPLVQCRLMNIYKTRILRWSLN